MLETGGNQDSRDAGATGTSAWGQQAHPFGTSRNPAIGSPSSVHVASFAAGTGAFALSVPADKLAAREGHTPLTRIHQAPGWEQVRFVCAILPLSDIHPFRAGLCGAALKTKGSDVRSAAFLSRRCGNRFAGSGPWARKSLLMTRAVSPLFSTRPLPT